MNDMISGLSNMYTNGAYSSATENLKDKLGTTDYSKATDEELMEACKTFESYFIEQAIKGMEKTIPDNDDSSASYLNMFKDTLYQEYADIHGISSAAVNNMRNKAVAKLRASLEELSESTAKKKLRKK